MPIFAEGEHKGPPLLPISFHGKMVTITKSRQHKNQDTPQHSNTHRATQRHLRILRHRRCVIPINPTPDKSHHDTYNAVRSLSSRRVPPCSVRLPKPTARRRYTKPKQNHPQTDDDHHNNRGDFDHRKPVNSISPYRRTAAKFANATSPTFGNQPVSTAPSPKPELDVDPNGGNFRDSDRHPHKPV